MDALETLLRPMTGMINRQIAARTPARELCSELDGRVLALRVADTALAMYLVIDSSGILLAGSYVDEPDVVVTGTLIALARLAGPAGDDLIRDGSVDITGDALLARQFQKLLRYGRPDIEEELSGVVGDAAAHGIGEFVRGLGEWGREARSTMRQNVGEYLQEETRAVPARREAEAFRNKVNALRDDVARFEARLSRLEKDLA